MSGFFRKVAGAFVYLDDPAKRAADQGSDSLDDVARETGELIAQLGTEQPAGTAPVVEGSEPAAIEMTANQVFAARGIVDGPNSSQRVLKVIAGLAMFPREQQLIMVRAMDAADDTWSETEVIKDAQRRQLALRDHLLAIEAEHTKNISSINERARTTQAEAQQTLLDVDRRIAELQKMRQQANDAAASALRELEVERTKAEESVQRSRYGINAVFGALTELIVFFRGGDDRSRGS
jgi:hypothetical protein